MTTRRGYGMLVRSGGVTVRLPGVPGPEFRARLARLGLYLAVLSDPEFREFGRALVGAAQSAEKSAQGGVADGVTSRPL